MKSLKTIAISALALVYVIVGSNLSTLHVSAGSSDIIVDNTSFAEELDTTKWNSPSGDVVAQSGKIIFSEDSTGDSRLITKLAATKSSQHEKLFSTDYSLILRKLPKGERFILGYSLAGIEAYYEESGNVELIFENKNGVKVSLLAYDENGEAISLAKSQSCGVSLGGTMKVSVNAKTDGTLVVKVNNKTIYQDTCPVDLAGRIGFLQTGACAVDITSVNIVSHKYDTPENTNIVEDFETGTMNANTLTSKMTSSSGYFPSGIQVEEYKGSNVLMFRNTNMGYFGTKYQYSNFELTFDVPYMLHKSILRENGTILAPNHSAFIVAIAGEAEDYDSFGYDSAADALTFTSTKVSSMRGEKPSADFRDKQFYEQNTTDGYSVKIRVVDTMLSVFMKALDATEYQEILTYKIGDSTPLGYVHIWSNGLANFAIDNFAITNLDKNGQVIELDYKEGFVTGDEDWEYQAMETIYVNDGGEEFNWFLITFGATIVGIVMVAISVVYVKIKKARKQEVKKL